MNKSAIVTIVLVLVIVAAVVFIVRGVVGGGTDVPTGVLATPEERIDQNTGELMTKTLAEWQKLGEQNGKYKNPTTGTYTMVVPFECTVCGEKIPPVDIPLEYTKQLPDPETRLKVGIEVQKLKAAHICPKCGKAAYMYEGASQLDRMRRGPAPK